VTTVDIYIRKADGSDSFSLHNGLLGAATTALHALISKFQDGTVSGPWHSSYIDTSIHFLTESTPVGERLTTVCAEDVQRCGTGSQFFLKPVKVH
jgi:hypothetical protein